MPVGWKLRGCGQFIGKGSFMSHAGSDYLGSLDERRVNIAIWYWKDQMAGIITAGVDH